MKQIFQRWVRYAGAAVASALFVFSGPALAEDIQRHGTAHVIYLPGDLDYLEVVDRLKTEILAANWDVTNVQDIDVGMRQYGLEMKNKVVSACKSQLLAKALKEDPFISLAVPCRFTIFHDKDNNRIVIGFNDPSEEAKALGVKQYQAAGQATEELRGVLQTLADFYKK